MSKANNGSLPIREKNLLGLVRNVLLFFYFLIDQFKIIIGLEDFN